MIFAELKTLARKLGAQMVQVGRRVDARAVPGYPSVDPVFGTPTRELQAHTRDQLKSICAYFGVQFRAREV